MVRKVSALKNFRAQAEDEHQHARATMSQIIGKAARHRECDGDVLEGASS